LLGYYALLTFAGLRPSEGARVRWEDINFETGELYVRKGKKEARHFILHPNAITWLKYHRNNSAQDAPFVVSKNLPNRERDVRQTTLNGEWIQDGLRHGMATYYNALVKNVAEVANVLGDDQRTVKRHYMRSVPERLCKEFWGLTPEVVLKAD
jgi:integrase